VLGQYLLLVDEHCLDVLKTSLYSRQPCFKPFILSLVLSELSNECRLILNKQGHRLRETSVPVGTHAS
jgi:hypothetical protein